MNRPVGSPAGVAGSTLGSADWGRASGGRLTLAEQCRFALQTVIAQLLIQWHGRGVVSDEIRQRWSRLDPDRIELPDTPTVARAVEVVQQSMPTWLCRHSLRTWSWAALLAQRDALQPDAEVLAVACLLHDAALVPLSHSPAGMRCACFAIDGGQRARRFLQEQGWAESRSLAVEDAICLHMNPQVPPGAGIEAHLLQRAAAMDVVGARLAVIDVASRQAVLARYPQTGFAQQMSEAMRHQAERAPDTRTRVLWRMGFEGAIRRSAWRECPLSSEPPTASSERRSTRERLHQPRGNP